MHEPLLERIRLLERAVRRWKVVSLALLLISISMLGMAGTFGFVLMLEDSHRHELMIMRVEAEMARDRAEQALQEAQAARKKLEQQGEKAAEANGHDGMNP